MDYFEPLRQKLTEYLDDQQIDLIHQAYLIADKAHRGQMRRSGEPYITHPVAVACILASMRMDPESIMAALMHDLLEDTQVSKNSIKKRFGPQVAELVDGVSKLTQIHFESRAQQQAENFRKMLLATARDIRVILIKLADRLHNMRTIMNMPLKKRRRIAKETLEIYAPMANRLGMHQVRLELEDLGLSALYPWRYKILSNAVKQARGTRKEILHLIKNKLKEILDQKQIFYYNVIGRKKHIFSIYHKMKTKQASFSEIMDVYGFRIIVDDIDTCYRVLGAVHSFYKPLPERFKDYISIPKANGYQSLHTTLFGPYGTPIEIQIRTMTMDRIAEQGIASHWLYKSEESSWDENQIKTHAWMKNLLELQQRAGNSLEFIENVKIDLFPEEVYVFTPKGEIIELSRGATPVDFAYAIHSDIGNSCVAAKVNRRFAPLSTQLVNGQTLEIITAPGARPNPAWLNFVVTAKARSHIRHFLKNQQREESILLGQQLLSRALEDLGHAYNAISQEQFARVVQEQGYQALDDLLEAIGLGNQMSLIIAQRLIENPTQSVPEVSTETKSHPLTITGTEGMVVTFSECCRPIPGDPIVGWLKPGRGIVVHTDNCQEVIKQKNPDQPPIAMCWESTIQDEFKVDITIEVFNQRWVLAQIASMMSDAEANIENIRVVAVDGQHIRIFLTLSIRNREHLDHVMRRLRSVKVVNKVVRGQL